MRLALLFVFLALSGSATPVDIYVQMGQTNSPHSVVLHDEGYDGGSLVHDYTVIVSWPFSRTLLWSWANQPAGRVHKVHVVDNTYGTNWYLTPTAGISVGNSSSTQIMDFNDGVAINYTTTVCFKNGDVYGHYFALAKNGLYQPQYGQAYIDSGNSNCWTITTTDTNGWAIFRFDVYKDPETGLSYTNTLKMSDIGLWGSPNGAGASSAVSGYSATAAQYPGTNVNPIAFNSTNAVAANNGTLQVGFSALYDAITKDSADRHNQDGQANLTLDQIRQNTGSLLTNQQSNFTGLTNFLGVGLTNVTADYDTNLFRTTAGYGQTVTNLNKANLTIPAGQAPVLTVPLSQLGFGMVDQSLDYSTSGLAGFAATIRGFLLVLATAAFIFFSIKIVGKIIPS